MEGGSVVGGIVAHSGLGAQLDQSLSAVSMPNKVAAWACWRSHRSASLRAWVDRLAGRRGRRIAVVALARRLSRILFAVWRLQFTYFRRYGLEDNKTVSLTGVLLFVVDPLPSWPE